MEKRRERGRRTDRQTDRRKFNMLEMSEKGMGDGKLVR